MVGCGKLVQGKCIIVEAGGDIEERVLGEDLESMAYATTCGRKCGGDCNECLTLCEDCAKKLGYLW